MSNQAINLASNAYRGDYMRAIVDKTIREIHDDMITVFGPGATDAYITKDGQPYYTRDGKEVISTLRFNNELANYVLKIMYQAVFNQAKAVGDGTTTVAVLYSNLYKNLREVDVNYRRELWHTVADAIIAGIKEQAVPMTEERLASMLLTCTQDHELAEKIYVNLKDAILDGSYIVIKKSDINTDFNMSVYEQPVIKATRQFSIRPVPEVDPNTVILYCNGNLDIAHVEILLALMQNVGMVNNSIVPKHFVLLCHGLTQATRNTTKDLVKLLNDGKADLSQYSNVSIYTLDDYRSYNNDQKQDISTMITDTVGIGGLVNALTFESLLYQSLQNENLHIEELETFDCDIQHIQRIREMVHSPYSVQFDDENGIRIQKDLGPVARNRYEQLRKQIEEETSEVKKVQLNRRLRSMYGQFIEVEVGSKLIKDSQRKYELILDAILSASEGVKYGVLEGNSLLVAARQCMAYYDFEERSASENNIAYDLLFLSIVDTMLDMIDNVYVVKKNETFDAREDLIDIIMNCDPKRFYLSVDKSIDKIDAIFEQDCTTTTPFHLSDGTVMEVSNRIVEPVTIVTNMFQNSDVILDLFNAQTFHLTTTEGNYI